MMVDGRLSVVVFFVALLTLFVVDCGREFGENSHPCTYFNSARYSSPEGNLVNCSWYAGNACCKRTEVTSVFGGMYPLFGSSRECSNLINYLMCYFCSPEQYIWYRTKARVCASFCSSVFEQCHTARYNGMMIGEMYRDSGHFCRGQQFSVVESNANCFNFDPYVFGQSPPKCIWSLILVVCLIVITLYFIDVY